MKFLYIKLFASTCFFMLGPCVRSTLANESASDTPSAIKPTLLTKGEDMELVFHDEFDGSSLNTSIWKSSEYGDGFKRDTFRGPDNLEVRDGRLLLKVRKEERDYKGKSGKWTAGLVYSRATLDNNVYIECRFKPTAATGIDNAFWLSCITPKKTSYSNRYEVDMPEARKVDDADNKGEARLAWHDWKTAAYIRDGKDDAAHIAQAIQLTLTWSDYHIWGLWLGENDMIYYLDGKEVWRGKTHPKYVDQWKTGIGKFDHWYPDEQQRAYGKFGQKDWLYSGGYTGDKMNIILSTLPWAASRSPLTDEADGTAMEVDYVRVWKPKRLLSRQPSLEVDFAKPNVAVSLVGDTKLHESGALMMKPKASATLALPKQSSTDPYYYSLIVKKTGPSIIRLQFENEQGKPLFQVGVNAGNVLLAGFDKPSRSDEAYPAKQSGQPFFTDNEDYLLVVRLTPGVGDEYTAVSMNSLRFPLGSEKEPYFYRNIDGQGNTSVNNGWMLNQKNHLAGIPSRVVLTNGGEGNILVRSFKAGPTYLSILPSK